MNRAPLTQDAKSKITQFLSRVLADTYILYVKTQNFHWNVVDPRFHELHEFFESQYKELAEAADTIAERIRMLGGRSPGSLNQFLEMGSLDENNEILSGDQMIQELANDHTLLADSLRYLIPETQKLGDEGSADMMINRLRAHEKNVWMLQSHLQQKATSKAVFA